MVAFCVGLFDLLGEDEVGEGGAAEEGGG